MLIIIEVKFKLPIIVFAILVRWSKKLHDVILCEQRTAENSHDLYDRPSQLEIMLNDTNEAVCNDGNMNLNTYSIVALTPKRLNLEMLFNPFEEQLNLPSVFINEGDVLGCKIEVVCVVSKRAVQIRSIVDNASDFAGIFLLVAFLRKGNGLVTQYIVLSVKDILASNNLVAGAFLLTDDKEGSICINPIKSGKVKVASVKDIACQRLVSKPIHSIDIMHVCIGDSVEHWYLSDNVHLCVNSDARLSASKLSPCKERHAEVDCCGVNGIEPSVQLKFSCNPPLLRKEHHMKSKLLKDAVVPEIVSLGKRTLVDGCFSKSEMKRFLTMGGCYICKFSQSFAAHELPEYKNKKLAPVGRCPILCPVVVLCYKTLEISLGKKTGNLSENVLSDMHICSCFGLDTKISISKVRQGFWNLLCCA